MEDKELYPLDDYIFCPLVDEKIDCVDCMENRYTCDSSIPEKYKRKKDWKDICNNCGYSEY